MYLTWHYIKKCLKEIVHTGQLKFTYLYSEYSQKEKPNIIQGSVRKHLHIYIYDNPICIPIFSIKYLSIDKCGKG